MSGQKVFPAKIICHMTLLLLSSWCCNSTAQDQLSYGHAATALLRRMSPPPCLTSPVSFLRAHSIQYSSDTLYFRCLPFQGCRDPLLSVSVDSVKLQQVNLP